MPKIRYQDIKFRAASLAIIAQANAIIGEYIAAGFRLTLRQLYYQFVARGIITNSQREYKRLGGVINDARLAGLLDWDAIEDRSRNLLTHPAWSSPESIVRSAAQGYRINPWLDQDWYVEVWIEKEALIGVAEVPCSKWRVPYFACRGYTSQSEMWYAGRNRLRYQRRAGHRVLVLHLGDHDPSGIDMTRDVQERLGLFAEGTVEVRRLALNMDQVEEWQPPPNPAKITDSRFAQYAEEHGDESWELDALDPETIAGLIETEIKSLIDDDAWSAALRRETSERRGLSTLADRYEDVIDWLAEEGEE